MDENIQLDKTERIEAHKSRLIFIVFIGIMLLNPWAILSLLFFSIAYGAPSDQTLLTTWTIPFILYPVWLLIFSPIAFIQNKNANFINAYVFAFIPFCISVIYPVLSFGVLLLHELFYGA